MEIGLLLLKGFFVGILMAMPCGPIAFWVAHIRLSVGVRESRVAMLGASSGDILLVAAVLFFSGFLRSIIPSEVILLTQGPILRSVALVSVGVFLLLQRAGAEKEKGIPNVRGQNAFFYFSTPFLFTMLHPGNVAFAAIVLAFFIHPGQDQSFLIFGFIPGVAATWSVGIALLTRLGDTVGKMFFARFLRGVGVLCILGGIAILL